MFRLGAGHDLTAQSADWHYRHAEAFSGFALVFLLLRSFASGCTALTGVEAISNGVPSFQKPKSKNAAKKGALALGAVIVLVVAILPMLGVGGSE